MLLFRTYIDEFCRNDSELYDLLQYKGSDGSAKSVIDYNIYTKGKRSMRLIGSCKGAGKSADGGQSQLIA